MGDEWGGSHKQTGTNQFFFVCLMMFLVVMLELGLLLLLFVSRVHAKVGKKNISRNELPK